MRARPDYRTQLWAVLRKETLQTARDRRLVFMLTFAPVMQLQLLVFGYAIDSRWIGCRPSSPTTIRAP